MMGAKKISFYFRFFNLNWQPLKICSRLSQWNKPPNFFPFKKSFSWPQNVYYECWLMMILLSCEKKGIKVVPFNITYLSLRLLSTFFTAVDWTIYVCALLMLPTFEWWQVVSLLSTFSLFGWFSQPACACIKKHKRKCIFIIKKHDHSRQFSFMCVLCEIVHFIHSHLSLRIRLNGGKFFPLASDIFFAACLTILIVG